MNVPPTGLPKWVASANELMLKLAIDVVELTSFCSLKPGGW